MITGEHAIIRTTDADDAHYFFRLYHGAEPRSFLLDRRHEVVLPTRDELQEMLGHKDLLAGLFYVVEDRTGDLRGFCALRGATAEGQYGEVFLALLDPEDYATPMADEALKFVLHSAFVQRHLNKAVAHCLDTEASYRRLLVKAGFQSNGVQRECVFTQGRWHDLETLTVYGTDCAGIEGPAEALAAP